jgi:hypothetical protein
LPIELVDEVAPISGYRQEVFRFTASAGDEWHLRLALRIPWRHADDKKPASQKQRETLKTFFWDTDVLPEKAGWQQASRLMDMRGLAYAVSETMDDGFLAANRIALAPLIAAYISRNAYLSAVARGWTLGTWRDSSNRSQSDWLMLVASPFYRELFEFALLAREDLTDVLNNQRVGES